MKKWLLIAIATAFVACGDSESKSVESSEIKSDSSVEKSVELSAESSAESTTQIAESSAETPQDLYKKCIACHGARGDKVAPGSVGSVLIADLSKASLVDSLKGYRAKTLSKGGTAAIMYLQANNLSDEDIEILGEYIASFKK